MYHFFTYLQKQLNDSSLFFCHSIAPCSFKDGTSASAICHLWKFVFSFNIYLSLNKLPLAALVAYPVALHSTLQHRCYSQRIVGSWLYPGAYFPQFFWFILCHWIDLFGFVRRPTVSLNSNNNYNPKIISVLVPFAVCVWFCQLFGIKVDLRKISLATLGDFPIAHFYLLHNFPSEWHGGNGMRQTNNINRTSVGIVARTLA